jgi:hypothetical protein
LVLPSITSFNELFFIALTKYLTICFLSFPEVCEPVDEGATRFRAVFVRVVTGIFCINENPKREKNSFVIPEVTMPPGGQYLASIT